MAFGVIIPDTKSQPGIVGRTQYFMQAFQAIVPGIAAGGLLPEEVATY